MLRGIYSAAGAMSLSMQKMNLFAQNLSNSQTMGYKKKIYSVHSFEDMLVQLPYQTDPDKKLAVATGSYIDTPAVNQKQGRLQQTGNALDVALLGENVHFQLQTTTGPTGVPAGTQRYSITRDGRFIINEQNYLVNQNGDYVLDTNNQRIRLTRDRNLANQPYNPQQPVPSMMGNQIKIDQFGRIFDLAEGANAPARAQIKLVNWTDNPNQPDDRQAMLELMKKYGISMPRDSQVLQSLNPLPPVLQGAPANPNAAPVKVLQGQIEGSNVDITTEMINLMMTSKDFDMSQKIISAEDKVLDKTINEMGRLQ